MIATVNDALSRDVADENGSRSDAVFRLRAEGLMRNLLPVLDWLGTYKGFPLTIDTIRSAFEWPWVRALARQQLVLLQDRRSGEYCDFCLAVEMPLALLLPVRDYVKEVESIEVMGDGGASDGQVAERQHHLLTMYFFPIFINTLLRHRALDSLSKRQDRTRHKARSVLENKGVAVMAMMMVDVPEGRTVHVIVGDAYPTTVAESARLVDERVPGRRRRPMLMTTAGFCILAVGFVLGHRTIASHSEADQPVASVSIPASSPADGASLNEGLPTPPPARAGLAGSGAARGPVVDSGAAGPAGGGAPTGGQVPSAFTQQLTAPPQVMPAPGAPADSGTPARNPFGLGG